MERKRKSVHQTDRQLDSLIERGNQTVRINGDREMDSKQQHNNHINRAEDSERKYGCKMDGEG